MNFADYLSHRRDDKKKILSIFLTAGYPTIDATVSLVAAAARAGADFIEIGIPFSDPIADGPTIQFSSGIALSRGVTLKEVFRLLAEISKSSNAPRPIPPAVRCASRWKRAASATATRS